MKNKLTVLLLVTFLLVSCDKKESDNSKDNVGISTAKRILSKLHLINLEEGLIQKQKIKEVYDLLKIVELNKTTIDTIAKNQIYTIFNNDSLAKSFIKKEAESLNNGYVIDSIKVVDDTIFVSLKNNESIMKRKFLYKMVKDSVIDKKLPPAVIFKILYAKYISAEKDTVSTAQ